MQLVFPTMPAQNQNLFIMHSINVFLGIVSLLRFIRRVKLVEKYARTNNARILSNEIPAHRRDDCTRHFCCCLTTPVGREDSSQFEVTWYSLAREAADRRPCFYLRRPTPADL